MKSMKNILGFKEFQVAGEKQCPTCGEMFPLYTTPKGVLGACKPCKDREFIKSLKLPSLEELKGLKRKNKLLQFEKPPADLVDATVNAYEPQHETQQRAKQVAIEYVKQFDGNQSLVLSGAPGLGKSHLAFAMVKALRKKGYQSFYIKTTNLIDLIKQSYREDASFTEEEIYTWIEDLDVLALDDIGSEYVKQTKDGYESWASDVLYKIFDLRIEKATICTTNYAEHELTQKYGNNGPRIISRMLYRARAIRFEGEDYRRRDVYS